MTYASMLLLFIFQTLIEATEEGISGFHMRCDGPNHTLWIDHSWHLVHASEQPTGLTSKSPVSIQAKLSVTIAFQ